MTLCRWFFPTFEIDRSKKIHSAMLTVEREKVNMQQLSLNTVLLCKFMAIMTDILYIVCEAAVKCRIFPSPSSFYFWPRPTLMLFSDFLHVATAILLFFPVLACRAWHCDFHPTEENCVRSEKAFSGKKGGQARKKEERRSKSESRAVMAYISSFTIWSPPKKKTEWMEYPSSYTRSVVQKRRKPADDDSC